MDGYTKGVLTVIAVALTVIAGHLLEPKEAIASPFGMTATTVGDFIDAGEIQDPKEREAATLKASRGMLIVRVLGGS